MSRAGAVAPGLGGRALRALGLALVLALAGCSFFEDAATSIAFY